MVPDDELELVDDVLLALVDEALVDEALVDELPPPEAEEVLELDEVLLSPQATASTSTLPRPTVDTRANLFMPRMVREARAEIRKKASPLEARPS